MRLRAYEIYHELTLDDTGTMIKDLTFKDPFSALHLAFKGTNGGTDNVDNWMNDVITKIEIVDGSDVLLSLSLKEAQARDAYRNNIMPYTEFVEKGDGTQRDDVMLNFGRYLWDPEYYLDLTKFQNPQLKITTDEDAVRATGATGFLAASFTVSIVAHVIEEGAVSPSKGFFMAKEIYSFTASTGEERIDLPKNYPYAAMMIHNPAHYADMDVNISQIKISCDNDKFVPLDQYTKYLEHENRCRYGPFQARGIWYRKGHENAHFPLHYNPTLAAVIAGTSGHIFNVDYIWSGRARLGIFDNAGAYTTTDEEIWVEAFGGAPHCCVWIPFGLLNVPASYFDTPSFGDIDLILTQAAAGTIKVVLDQLRSD